MAAGNKDTCIGIGNPAGVGWEPLDLTGDLDRGAKRFKYNDMLFRVRYCEI